MSSTNYIVLSIFTDFKYFLQFINFISNIINYYVKNIFHFKKHIEILLK